MLKSMDGLKAIGPDGFTIALIIIIIIIVILLRIWSKKGPAISIVCRTLFAWSRAWGFTSRDSIPSFLDSLSSCT